jgi:tRNA pseudouridine38-40 synthase
MDEAAAFLKGQTNYFAFAKTNTQVKNFHCTIFRSEWKTEGDELVFYIGANRFLRGMVRLLTASIIKVGRGKLPMEAFQNFFEGEGKCGHSVPAHGLYLVKVAYPENYFPAMDGHLTGF